MNDEQIEQLLRKAPPLTPPPTLLKQLQADVSLPGREREFAAPPFPVSWFRRWMPAVSFCGFVIGCLGIIAMQSDAISKLRHEKRAPANQTKTPDPSGQTNRDARPLRPQIQELDRLRKENAELQSLRAEAAQLRVEIAVLPQLRVENQKLLAELTSVASTPENDALEKARQASESERCVNNLKNIGLAAHIFATDHQDVFPRDFLAMTNELSTPKILHCPSDSAKAEAEDWSVFSALKNSYEMLSPSLKYPDPSVVFVRCPIHGHIGMSDGSVLASAEKRGFQIVIKDGKRVLIHSSQPATFE